MNRLRSRVLKRRGCISWEQGIAIISISISVVSIGVTLYNSSKQREIEEKLQKNEFEYSRKKIWYTNQSQAIEEVLEELSQINKLLMDFSESLNWSFEVDVLQFRFAILDGQKLGRLYHIKQVYFDKEMNFLIKEYISILDNIKNKLLEYKNSEIDNELNQEWATKQINILLKTYYKLINEINERY